MPRLEVESQSWLSFFCLQLARYIIPFQSRRRCGGISVNGLRYNMSSDKGLGPKNSFSKIICDKK